MKCLEFKRLALSDPNSRDQGFLAHSVECPECLKYVGGVRQMDSDLAKSIDVEMPSDLIARLQLNQELVEETEESNVVSFLSPLKRYAVAASLALAVFVAGFMASNQFGVNSNIDEDYQALLSSVVEHMNEQAVTPVWDADRANKTANTLLASYDGEMQLKYLSNLQFSRVCPMGQYKGLHATLDTPDGQVTFAYIKGDSVGSLFDAGIMSRTNKAVQEADSQLEEAMYWDI